MAQPPTRPNQNEPIALLPVEDRSALADQLSRGIQATQTLFTGLLAETREKCEAIAELRTDLKLLRREVESLMKIVRDGNGQKSLILRLSSVEGCIEAFENKLTEYEEGKEEARGHLVAIVVAMISLFASVIVPIIQYALGH